MVVLHKLMVFVLMFAILVVLHYILDIVKAYRENEKLGWDNREYIILGTALSYILTIIFTGFSLV